MVPNKMKKVLVFALTMVACMMACTNSGSVKPEASEDSLEWDTILIDPATYKYRDVLDVE